MKRFIRPPEHEIPDSPIASTDPLERVNEEVKCRSDVHGMFPNEDAVIRLVGAPTIKINDEWTVVAALHGGGKPRPDHRY